MHLIEIFIPLPRSDGRKTIEVILHTLTEEFGGATAFSRAPAQGLWKDDEEVESDDIVILEVMVERIDKQWWASFRQELEKKLSQKEIVIRSSQIERL